ncbi:MAG: protein translocase subunit SecD [Candidatus Bipolaricaulota bacterium]|nr:protein translocase subunit SecD [Candidatus Bipolaricaulota bacterium]MCS7274980.1 protein translocase subunit SecD [Candidatus Bipolaricaulota bacterium]MDW8110355.1 protein translocase subunit SecD [Candidatus Bipolaricaulota bacterium]MDW8328749.1 protein translocase subunit SecD [Candidatus Bipolaricaulota bacterium]
MKPELAWNLGRLVLVTAAIVAAVLFIYTPWHTYDSPRECMIEEIRLGLDLCGGIMLTLEVQIDPDKIVTADERQKTVERVLSVLERRINALGLTEPQIAQVGDTRISVQLPGTTDPQQARQLVGSTALLEFRKVVKAGTPGETPTTEEFDEEVLPGYLCDRSPADCVQYVVKKEPLMTGDILSKAEVRINPNPGQGGGAILVALTLNESGARQFRDVILQLKAEQDPIAIVLDRVVYSAPVVAKSLQDEARRKAAINEAVITGQFTPEEARLLAAILSAGALPAEIVIKQESIVGPTLGRDSIEKGLTASLIAGLAVMLFMVVYYRWSGMVANFTLLTNLIVLLGILAGFKATLTLPGIAGIILLVGMGVDSSVLIFERMREELRLGKVARAAIDAGYQRALTTIWDSHVTTLITSLILFVFGTGPIRGFATTLSVGVLVNLFTVLLGTRLIFEFVKMRKVERLSI